MKALFTYKCTRLDIRTHWYEYAVPLDFHFVEIKYLIHVQSLEEFEKEALISTSFLFLYANGKGNVWRLTELVMTRYFGKEVSTMLEATFNRERKPGEMKSSDIYYRLQQPREYKKSLPNSYHTMCEFLTVHRHRGSIRFLDGQKISLH